MSITFSQLVQTLELKEAKIKIDAGEKEVTRDTIGKKNKVQLVITSKGKDFFAYFDGEKYPGKYKSEKDIYKLAKDFEKLVGEELKEAPEDNEPASPDEGSMAIQQLEFIAYAAEEIKQHISNGGKFPEWMQNKLAKVNGDLQSLHANIDHDNVNGEA
jgi:hypothetical protein